MRNHRSKTFSRDFYHFPRAQFRGLVNYIRIAHTWSRCDAVRRLHDDVRKAATEAEMTASATGEKSASCGCRAQRAKGENNRAFSVASKNRTKERNNIVRSRCNVTSARTPLNFRFGPRYSINFSESRFAIGNGDSIEEDPAEWPRPNVSAISDSRSRASREPRCIESFSSLLRAREMPSALNPSFESISRIPYSLLSCEPVNTHTGAHVTSVRGE